MTGGGTISPGIPGPTGGTAPNSVSFDGSMTGVFVDTTAQDAGQCAISMSGSGTDSTAIGSGAGNFNCTGTGIRGTAIALSNCHVDITASVTS